MRQILSDSQQDPRALMDHMKNPMVKYHGVLIGLESDPFVIDRSEDPKAHQLWYHQDKMRYHFTRYSGEERLAFGDIKVERCGRYHMYACYARCGKHPLKVRHLQRNVWHNLF